MFANFTEETCTGTGTTLALAGASAGAVNSMYARFEASGDEFIENEYTIKELAELRDLRDELGVNSYTQDRLEYLNSRVKH